MGQGSTKNKIKWNVTGGDSSSNPNAWATHEVHRGYSGTIAYAAGVYTLSVTGTSTYSSTWPTLKGAKNDYRKFLLVKP